MPADIQKQHFRVVIERGRNVTRWIPGYSGPIIKNLNNPLPLIIETGVIDTDNLYDVIFKDAGDPTKLVRVTTGRQGHFDNCYKVFVPEISGHPDRVGPPLAALSDTGTRRTIVEYVIYWQQVAPN